MEESIIDKINHIDWSKYSGVEYYEPKDVAKSLIDLILLNDAKQAEKVGNNILSTVGNNHAGTYYPAMIEAIDVIIYAALNAKNSVSSRCAFAILEDMYASFEAEMGNYSGCTGTELDNLVSEKIEALLPILQKMPQPNDLVDLIVGRKAL